MTYAYNAAKKYIQNIMSKERQRSSTVSYKARRLFRNLIETDVMTREARDIWNDIRNNDKVAGKFLGDTQDIMKNILSKHGYYK